MALQTVDETGMLVYNTDVGMSIPEQGTGAHEMITFIIDELTECLQDSVTGEKLETEVIELKRKSLLSRFNSKNGWYVNWGTFPEGVRVFALVLKGTFDIQGLIAIEPDYDAKAVHIVWACTAPQNNKWRYGFQKYIGVGGHLFAIAAELSEKYGFEGYLYGEAMDEDIMRYYIEKFEAIELPREHPFSIGFTGNATMRIREAYNYVWTEDNS